MAEEGDSAPESAVESKEREQLVLVYIDLLSHIHLILNDYNVKLCSILLLFLGSNVYSELQTNNGVLNPHHI